MHIFLGKGRSHHPDVKHPIPENSELAPNPSYQTHFVGSSYNPP